MTADLIHEFKNLLTVIAGSLEQLRRQQLNDRGQQQLARAESGAQRACDLLATLVDVTDSNLSRSTE